MEWIGEFIEWAGFYGIVTEVVETNHHTGSVILRVHWTDGGTSTMYSDELTRFKE